MGVGVGGVAVECGDGVLCAVDDGLSFALFHLE